MDKQLDPNKLFKARLGQGEVSLRILLSNSSKTRIVSQASAESNRNRKLGTIKSSRQSGSIVGRKKQTGYIQFWDFGQIKDGSSWVDINYSQPLDDAGSFNHNAITSADWDALRDLILAVDPADWETQYRKLTYEEGELYGLDLADNLTGDYYPVGRNGTRLAPDGSGILTGNENIWTPNGLVIPAPLQNFRFDSYGAFQLLSVDDTSTDLKITTTPSYSDPDVPFTLQKNAKVFLVPRIESIFAVAGSTDLDYSACEWQALQRSFWLTKVFEDTGYEFPALSYRVNPITFDILDLSDADKIALVSSLKGQSGTTAWSTVAGYHSPSTWPTHGNSPAFLYIEKVGSSIVPVPAWKEGTLLACIKQEGQVYYFWNATDGAVVTNGMDIDISGLV